MTSFKDALCCCCCCEDREDGLRMPDMSRYEKPISWTSSAKDLYGSVDFEVEELDNGIRTHQETSPLVNMPDSLEYLSTRYFVEPPDVIQRSADLGKCDS